MWRLRGGSALRTGSDRPRSRVGRAAGALCAEVLPPAGPLSGVREGDAWPSCPRPLLGHLPEASASRPAPASACCTRCCQQVGRGCEAAAMPSLLPEATLCHLGAWKRAGWGQLLSAEISPGAGSAASLPLLWALCFVVSLGSLRGAGRVPLTDTHSAGLVTSCNAGLWVRGYPPICWSAVEA